MSWSLGVDLGTTFVAASVARSSGPSEMVTLSSRSVVAPAVVYLGEDGELVSGDTANRRAITAPDRMGREFKRRLGDPTPLKLGDRSFSPTELLATLLRDVLGQVSELEGGQPERVVLTHPANWGPYRRGLFEEVPRLAGVTNALTTSEPEAAAAHYAVSRELRAGQVVAVYDLGGGTFDATVLRGGASGVEILGIPEGIDRLGGVDFDEAILNHVNYQLGGILDGIDVADANSMSALARLRQDCVHAKEALSTDAEVTIPVFLPGRHGEVVLARDTFEAMVRGQLESTIGVLLRTVRSAGLEPAGLNAVLLIGGSSRIPLVARMVANELGCRTVVDAHPKYTVALGAAKLSAAWTQPATATVPSNGTGARSDNGAGNGSSAGPARRARRKRSAQPAPSTVAPTPAAVGAGPAPTLTGTGPPAKPPAREMPMPQPSHSDAGTSPGPDSGPGPVSAPRRHRPRTVLLGIGVLAVVLALGWLIWPTISAGPHPSAGQPGPALPLPPTQPAVAASLANPTVAASIPVEAPQSGAIAPDGKLAYFASTNTHSITIVDLASGQTIGSIPIAQGPPQYIAFTPDGSRAYVSVYDQIRETGNVVVVIDTATKSVIGSIPAQKFPYELALTPNGQQLFIPNHDFPAITVADTKTNAVTQTIVVKPSPHSVAFSLDGRRAYLANHYSNVLTVLDTQSRAIIAEIPVATSPHCVAISPNGAHLYVVGYDANAVSVINSATNTVSATIPVQREPQSVAFSPDSRHAYVVNDGSNSVSVIDTATGQITATVGVGQDPTNVFVTPDGKHAYVSNIGSNNVTVLNTSG